MPWPAQTAVPGHGLSYLLADLATVRTAGSRTMSSVGERLSVFVLAAFVLVAIVASRLAPGGW